MHLNRHERGKGPNPDGDWKIAVEHYQWDRLEAAYERALSTGVGIHGQFGTWTRIIEAEFRTRLQSRIEDPQPWLHFEYLESDLGESIDRVRSAILRCCDDVGRELDYPHGDKTMISILAEETDAPWLEGRFGYFIHKHPYHKICLPFSCTKSDEDLSTTVRHEYAHAISFSLSNGQLPDWLGEAISMVVAKEADHEARRAFLNQEAEWLGPHELDAAFSIHQADVHRHSKLWMAYQQSAWIGRYLELLGGEHKLNLLLRAFANNDFWTNLKLSLLRRDLADEALAETYGISEAKVFSQAREWLGSSEATSS